MHPCIHTFMYTYNHAYSYAYAIKQPYLHTYLYVCICRSIYSFSFNNKKKIPSYTHCVKICMLLSVSNMVFVGGK